MKKKFIEPEIKRIELNLNENIASSEPYSTIILGGIEVTHALKGCLEQVIDTGLHYNEVTYDNYLSTWNCFVKGAKEAAYAFGFKNVY